MPTVTRGRWTVQTRLPPRLGARWEHGGRFLADGGTVPAGGGWVLNGELLASATGKPADYHHLERSATAQPGVSSAQPLNGIGAWHQPSAPVYLLPWEERWQTLVQRVVEVVEIRRQASATLARTSRICWEASPSIIASSSTPSVLYRITPSRRALWRCVTGLGRVSWFVVRSLLESPTGRNVLLWICGGSVFAQWGIHLWEHLPESASE